MRGSRNFRQGGVQVNLTKKLTTFFLVLSLYYRRQRVNFKENYQFSRFIGGPTFSRGGIQLFPGGGGGGAIAYSLWKIYNLWFSRGGPNPLPPSGFALGTVHGTIMHQIWLIGTYVCFWKDRWTDRQTDRQTEGCTDDQHQNNIPPTSSGEKQYWAQDI